MTLLTIKQNLPEEFMQLITDQDARDLFSNFAEVALDSLVDDGFLKDVPIIGTFMGITRTVLAIQDRIFTKVGPHNRR